MVVVVCCYVGSSGFLFHLCCPLQVVLRPQAGQEVQVELYDKDMDKDDFLGR